MPINLISDVRPRANMLRMLAWRKKKEPFFPNQTSFPLTSRQNQCHGKQRSSLSGLVNYGGLVCHHQTDESVARWLSGELTTL